MKTFFKILLALMVAQLPLRVTAAEGTNAAGTNAVTVTATNAPAKYAAVRSVFAIPASVREGRDPFFPESTRNVEVSSPATKSVEVSALNIKGISGTAAHRLVIINNHTFAVGDEGDVTTPTGRVHIRCTEIRPDLVAVEINGRRHELHVSVP